VNVAPTTKEAQRAELHKTIWRIANDLRGAVDGWDFKSYVLGMLFYRFISENLTAYLNEQERQAGNPDFDYVQLSHKDAEHGRKATVEEKGFFIFLETCSSMSARKPRTTRTLTRPWSGSSTTSRRLRSAPTARTTSRVCLMTLTSTAPSSATRWRGATRSLSSCSTPSAI